MGNELCKYRTCCISDDNCASIVAAASDAIALAAAISHCQEGDSDQELLGGEGDLDVGMSNRYGHKIIHFQLDPLEFPIFIMGNHAVRTSGEKSVSSLPPSSSTLLLFSILATQCREIIDLSLDILTA